MGIFDPFTFHVDIDMIGLCSAISFFIYCLFLLFLSFFCRIYF